MTILFCNIGWMESYQGLGAGDQIVGGGAYVAENGTGHEICNFVAHRTYVYGYVQVRGSQIDIERMGANPADDSISGVTIIWTAKRPEGGSVVVGWYKNATVYRSYQTFSNPSAVHLRNKIDGYWIRVLSKDAQLLLVDDRTLIIPKGVKGGMGQSNVWYADQQESGPLVKSVLGFVDGTRRKPAETKGAKGKKGKQDQERKAKIEQAALRLCSAHFESLGYFVESVEKDNRGWDLEARFGKILLRIEVKGLSGDSFSVELTPNEFKAFSQELDEYRLAVVTCALDKPALHVCRYSKEKASWVVDDQAGRTLKIEKKMSARIESIQPRRGASEGRRS